MVRLAYLFPFLIICLSLPGCGDFVDVDTRNFSSGFHSGSGDAKINETISSPEFLNLIDASFSNFGNINPSDTEAIWAVSHTQKFAKHKFNLLGKWAEGRGALPQILTPSIRQEIEDNELLQQAASLPDFLKSMLKFFVDDSYILSEIQGKITGLLDKILNQNTKLHKKNNFRFDHFLSATPETTQGKISYSEFAFEEQFVRWFNVFSIDNYWSIDEPLFGDNHGLQLFSSLRALSELQYTLGLANPGETKAFGGLSFDIKEGSVSTPAIFDLRMEPNATRYLSGKFKLSYKNGDIVDIASDLSESWSSIPAPTTLNEQAKLWMAGAKLFERLRPALYQRLNSFYEHALCKEAFGMSLSILSSMNNLLSGPFIDVDARFVRKYAKIPNNTQPFSLNENEPAGLMESIRSVHAVYLWAQQLKDQTDLKEFQSQHGLEISRLETAYPRLKDTMRLFLQSLFKNFIGPENIAQTMSELTLAEQAEVVVVLTIVEQNMMQSSYLKTSVDALVHEFFTAKINSKLSEPKLSQVEVAWVVALVDTLALAQNPVAQSKEFAALHSIVKEK